MKKIICLFSSFIFFTISGCTFAENTKNAFSIVNWNVQTFFDGNNDGIEYSDFKKSEKWGTEAYKARLLKLCKAIKEINADVFVFEEIENSGIIYDITNQLAGNSWSSKNCWNYAAFAKNPADAIGCAVISKLPLSNMTLHNLDVRSESEKQPSMRPIIKIELSCGGKTFCLLVNHWKSKSGGSEKSEIWRKWQENVLYKQFSENSHFPIISCGDFNKDINEFELLCGADKTSDAQTIIFRKPNLKLRKFCGSSGNDNTAENNFIEVYSPWINEIGGFKEPGSYYYDSKWERIDNFFANENTIISAFKVLTDGEWCNADFIPKRYKIYNGEGFSDHLPIKCLIEAERNL